MSKPEIHCCRCGRLCGPVKNVSYIETPDGVMCGQCYDKYRKNAEVSSLVCPDCGGNEFSYQIVSEHPHVGVLKVLAIIVVGLLCCILHPLVGIIVAIVMIIAFTRPSNVTYAVCQKCGKRIKS